MNLKKIFTVTLLIQPILFVLAFDLNQLTLPSGFKIELYASNLLNPRGLTVTPDNTVYVGSKSGYVYKISPNRSVEVIAEGLNGPIGIDYYKGDLYLSEIDKIRVFKQIQNQNKPYNSKILNVDLPDNNWHGWKYIKVGSDDKIYINIGAPCNICKPTGYYGTISRMDLDGNKFEIYVNGVRNSVGFDWSPIDGKLWFTDNGPDKFGDNLPPDEINKVTSINEHFGFPYMHGDNVKDPTYYSEINNRVLTNPEWALPAHVAALGMRFYRGNMFPKEYSGGIFVAEHGSWNRASKIGYRVSFLKIEDGKIVDYNIFASGWEIDEVVYGRPVDVEQLIDGSLIISDDFSGNIYRISY